MSPRRPFREFDDSHDAESLRLARRIIRGLAVSMRHVVLAPGSRSAPLAYALAEAEQLGALSIHMRIDERSAAFTALGLAVATGEPAAVVTTSGTAAGNLLPAVMEADLSGTPLVVITADRPESLHGTGANQTLWQQGMFAGRVRDELHLEQGQVRLEPIAADDILAVENQVGLLLSTAVTASRQAAPGPVHLNAGFADPLVPRELPDAAGSQAQRWARRGVAAGARTVPHRRAATDPSAGAVEGDNAPQGPRTLFVMGHQAPEEAIDLAFRQGHPMLAEPTSGARWSDLGPVQGYRMMLEAPGHTAAGELVKRAELVVVAGRPTLSRPVQRLISQPGLEVLQYAPDAEPWHDHRLPRRILTSAAELRSTVGSAPAQWSQEWERAGLRAQGIIDAVLREQDAAHGALNSVRVAQYVAERVRTPLLLGSSSVIRDVDLTAALVRTPPTAGTVSDGRTGVYALRGVAGIDGNLSAAAGISLAQGTRVTALVGDLTFLHDINALLVPGTERAPDVDIVIINDAGGAIFDRLEHGEVGRRPGHGERVERLFATPQSVDIAALARAYRHSYVKAENLEQLDAALAHPDDRLGIRLIEVRTDRNRLDSLYRDFKESASRVL